MWHCTRASKLLDFIVKFDCPCDVFQGFCDKFHVTLLANQASSELHLPEKQVDPHHKVLEGVHKLRNLTVQLEWARPPALDSTEKLDWVLEVFK
ncbi:hypothetical protein K3495_g4947 [Podosphaera aphanis]|nr:hypothetical protein K3495_g4947 [Podosphaera aphanis]